MPLLEEWSDRRLDRAKPVIAGHTAVEVENDDRTGGPLLYAHTRVLASRGLDAVGVPAATL